MAIEHEHDAHGLPADESPRFGPAWRAQRLSYALSQRVLVEAEPAAEIYYEDELGIDPRRTADTAIVALYRDIQQYGGPEEAHEARIQMGVAQGMIEGLQQPAHPGEHTIFRAPLAGADDVDLDDLPF